VSRALLATVAALAGGAALAGCADRGQDAGTTASPEARTTTVERTKVEVLKDLGKRSGFDPQAIYEQVSPGVVTVVSGGERGGVGSGFVLGDDGEVVTNAHVVTTGEGASIKRAGEVYVSFEDGNEVPARIVGFDPFSDVALLKVDPDGLKLRPLELGSTRGLRVGAPVAAIGSPFGEDRSLSTGVISALDRSIESLTGFATPGAIQTDAAINQGNSGGPLLDAAGRVLGINSQIETSSGDGSGVGFAVAVDTIRRSLDQLRSTGKAKYAYLGVATAPVFPQLATRFGIRSSSGAWVQEVTPDGPADDAGVRKGSGTVRFQGRGYSKGGDVIVSFDGEPVRDENDLARLVAEHRPGQRVRMRLLRGGGDARDVTVTLGERPLGDPPER
jgi:S1-C subfamily serine protease